MARKKDDHDADDRKRGGRVKEREKAPVRKRGGHIAGERGEDRPDRRARGGATSDRDPLTSAGKMSKLPFEHGNAPAIDEGGKSRD